MFPRRLILLLVLAALVAACGGSLPREGGTAGAATPPPASQPAATDELAATDEPTPTATEEPATTSTPLGSDDPPASGEPTEALTGAEACSGSADNRDFFLGFAAKVDWPVLCGVLPPGWFVSKGVYRLANGGKLLVSYTGPGGASMALSQGAWCTSDDGCVPEGTPLGSVPLGPLEGALYGTDDGFAVIAAPGENPSWLVTTEGLDRAATEDLAAALAEVGR